MSNLKRVCPCPELGKMWLQCAACGKMGDAYYMFADLDAKAGTFLHDTCTGLEPRDTVRHFTTRHLREVPNV